MAVMASMLRGFTWLRNFFCADASSQERPWFDTLSNVESADGSSDRSHQGDAASSICRSWAEEGENEDEEEENEDEEEEKEGR